MELPNRQLKVPLGINQQELIKAAGGLKGSPEKVISGGPMMGFAMFTLDVPVTKLLHRFMPDKG